MTIFNLGSINIDHVYQVPHFVTPGETMASTGYQRTLGGKGANQSIALARAGVDVKHIGKLHGSDDDFKQLIDQYGVDCSQVAGSESASGHAIIQVTGSGENAIVLFGGANQDIVESDIDLALSGAQSGDWLLTQNETSGIGYAMAQARAKGLKVAFNPAPMTESVKSLAKEHVDLLVVNEVEAAELTGCEEIGQIVAYFKQHWAHAEVIMTLGKAGVVMLKGGQQLEVSAYSVDAIDTTAAGDTFIGFFLSAYTQGQDATLALKQACAASALGVTQSGAAQSIPDLQQVQAFIEENS